MGHLSLHLCQGGVEDTHLQLKRKRMGLHVGNVPLGGGWECVECCSRLYRITDAYLLTSPQDRPYLSGCNN
jgi:hypothetical protein